MRHPIVIALALTFAAAPVALAQQEEPPNPIGDPTRGLGGAPVPAVGWSGTF